MSEERKLGLGTFSEFKITNRSQDQNGEKAGVVPGPIATDCAYPAKNNGDEVIRDQQTGQTDIPPGIPSPTTVHVWGQEESSDDTWYCYELIFDLPIESLDVTNTSAASTWGQAGMLEVTATGEDPNHPPTLQGDPQATPNPAEPTWC